VGNPRAAATREFAAWRSRPGARTASRVWDDPVVREQIVRYAIDEEVARGLSMWTQWATANGDRSGVPNACTKLFNSERAQVARLGHDRTARGRRSIDLRGADAPMGAAVQEAALVGTLNTIAGGSSEIMRNIIAERALGLPRSRPPGSR